MKARAGIGAGKSAPGGVLTLNAGSSSIRFALFEGGSAERRILEGAIERIGTPGARLSVNREGVADAPRPIQARDHRSAARHLLDWLQGDPLFAGVSSLGHRIVHGMRHSAPERVTPRLQVGEVEVLLQVETRGPEHCEEMITELRQAGYTLIFS